MDDPRFMPGIGSVDPGKSFGLQRQNLHPRESGELRIGFVHLDALCWTFFRYQLLVQASKRRITILDRPVGTLKEQIAAIDGLLQEQINVLMLRPVASGDAHLLEAVRRARTLGVEVISLDGSIGGDIDTTTVSVDNVAGQAAITSFVCQRLGGRGKIAHLQGNQSMEAGKLRTQGLHSVLARYPEIDLVHEVELDWGSPVPLRVQGRALAHQALAAHPTLAAIITTSDESAFGVRDALVELGWQNEVLITGFDALPEALIAIEDRRIEASVYQPLELMAERALFDAARLVYDEPGLAVHTKLPAETISRANLVDACLRALRLFPSVISELGELKRQQQMSASFLDTLVDNLPDILIVKDAETLSYVRRNRAADDWLGVESGSLQGKTAFDVYPEEVAARLEASDRETLAAGVPVEISDEVSFLRDKGTRHLHTRKVPILNAHGKPVYLLIVSQDLTEQVVAEIELAQRIKDLELAIETLRNDREKLVAAEKMAALGSLVAGVAHELNTPIGNALLAASTLMDATHEITDNLASGLSRSMLSGYLADASDGARILERNLHRAADLVNSFKQIAVDQEDTRIRRFSLSALISDVLMTLMPTIKKSPVSVKQCIPEDIELFSFPGPLEQVLINLVNNAVIHGLAGCESGEISISGSVLDAGRVKLVVEDNGKGIPEEQLKNVFTPFYTTKGDEGGSGLGLSITQSIVTGLLGGEIELVSTVGVGTRFTLTIPLVAESPPRPGSSGL